jgi:GMP synthase-like glutamine amidotransferase
LITGSKFGVYENHSWIPTLEDFLRHAYAEAVPIVGICFGHKLMAYALGGRVEKYPAAGL